MMKNSLKILILFLLTGANFQGKSQDISSLKYEQLDSFLLASNKNQWVMGATVLVMQNNKTVFNKTYGFRDREANAILKTDDIFRIASMTKPIVTVAAMILVERGQLSLDDEIWKYIPSFKNPQVLKSYDASANTWVAEPARSQITVRQLMTHTAGVGSGQDDKILGTLYAKNGFKALMFADSIELGTAVKKLATLPLAAHPGEKFHYGSSTDVLGYIVEVISGEKLDVFVSKNILVPLKMEDTYFFMPEAKKDRLVVLYAELRGGKLTRIPQGFQGYNINYPFSGPKKYLSGGGGMSSTVQDYAKFLSMILNNGTSLEGKRILKPATVAQMAKNQIGAVSLANSNKFGLGFEIESRQNPPRKASIGKLSWGGAFNTTFWIDPKRKSIAILMSQVYPAIHQRDLYSGFERFVNEALAQ